MSRQVAKKKNDYFWKPADKSRAVAAYVATGSYSKVATITGVPEATVRLWAKQEWWAEESKRVDKADSDEIKGVFTRIVKKATSELEDRLERGDEVVTKDGDIVMKKIPGKELAIIAAVAADKRKQQMDQPETVAVQNSQEKLVRLMEEFLKFANAKEVKYDRSSESVSGEDYRIIEGDSGADQRDPGTETTGPSNASSDASSRSDEAG